MPSDSVRRRLWPSLFVLAGASLAAACGPDLGVGDSDGEGDMTGDEEPSSEQDPGPEATPGDPEPSACAGGDSITGDFDVTNQQQLEHFRGCRVIEGGLTISGVSDLSPLSSLQAINHLSIRWLGPGTDSPASLAGLEALETVDVLALNDLRMVSGLDPLVRLVHAGSIGVHGLGAIVELIGPPSLSTIDNGLSLSNLHALERIVGFDGLHTIGGLAVHDCAQLRHIGGFSGVDGSQRVSLARLPVLTEAPAMATLLSGDTELTLDGMPSSPASLFAGVTALASLTMMETDAVDLSSFSSLRELDYLRLYRNLRLETLRGLESIRSLEDGLSLVGNVDLHDGSGLSSLEHIGTVFDVGYGQPSLLVNLVSLAEIGGELRLWRVTDEVLSWPSGLTSIDELYISENGPLYSLGTPPASLTITGSARVFGNETLADDHATAWFKDVAVSGLVKVANNSGSGLLDPCPWEEDGECDDHFLCQSGSDPIDCVGEGE